VVPLAGQHVLPVTDDLVVVVEDVLEAGDDVDAPDVDADDTVVHAGDELGIGLGWDGGVGRGTVGSGRSCSATPLPARAPTSLLLSITLLALLIGERPLEMDTRGVPVRVDQVRELVAAPGQAVRTGAHFPDVVLH